MAPQDLTTEITSMNSTKISLENELSEAEKNILDNKQEQIELYSEINQSIALIASWKKIESLTESLLSVESSLATISLQSENNKT
ncbi:hypothetical protein H6768_00595 [Candidatus Peribacteria bacterium]|nr:hypothetical protein [Candidatus Peribacteria bacterium]